MINKFKRVCLLLFVALVLVGCGNSSSSSGTTETGELKISYLSVGQADAAIVSCDGHNAMIDCGSTSLKDENNFNSQKIEYYLGQKDIDIHEFDYFFCSHYDEDHFCGFTDILDTDIEVSKIYGPSGSGDINTNNMNAFRNALKFRHKKIKTPKVGKTFSLGSAEIEVLAVDSDRGTGKNDDSLVLMVTYGSTKFLFAGDGETKTEQEICKSKSDLDCDVLKVAHHGSDTSTKPQFLSKVKPEYAILSVAANNDKLPNANVIIRLETYGAKVFRTDEEGIIICESDGKTITLSNGDGEKLN